MRVFNSALGAVFTRMAQLAPGGPAAAVWPCAAAPCVGGTDGLGIGGGRRALQARRAAVRRSPVYGGRSAVQRRGGPPWLERRPRRQAQRCLPARVAAAGRGRPPAAARQPLRRRFSPPPSTRRCGCAARPRCAPKPLCAVQHEYSAFPGARRTGPGQGEGRARPAAGGRAGADQVETHAAPAHIRHRQRPRRGRHSLLPPPRQRRERRAGAGPSVHRRGARDQVQALSTAERGVGRVALGVMKART